VCAALGQRFGMSANLVRLIFLLSCLLPGPQFIIYIAAWIIIPAEPVQVRVMETSSR